ncbi:Aste57867_13091 [Aphanomyces stellatus]|uniref:Aste57867_13091 protein n=1 Tax=Aphanomyces stellatus TaxID=120398 RepID=A0A485KX89_9STRA|nr:hypothetical protein As57867_013043 [Aphanomyces stellatus]VFT89935.1 Aste57867_13091 [Aphanomyces stellatus]
MVESYLLDGAEIDAANNDGATPLFLASSEGLLDIVELLIKHNANVEISRKDGISPLIIASYFGYADVVKRLVNAGANLTVSDEDGTARDNALAQGHLDIVEYLDEVHRNHAWLADEQHKSAIAFGHGIPTEPATASIRLMKEEISPDRTLPVAFICGALGVIFIVAFLFHRKLRQQAEKSSKKTQFSMSAVDPANENQRVV